MNTKDDQMMTDKKLQELEDMLTEFNNAPQGEPQDVNDPSYEVPLETPSWGEEAAEIVLKMAEERASYIQKFAATVVNRADEWARLAGNLAENIRTTAKKEADAIRRETARMYKAGNRIEVALREFTPEKEKPNGRDRPAREATSRHPSDRTGREPLQQPTVDPADARAGARAIAEQGVAAEGELKIPGFLSRQR